MGVVKVTLKTLKNEKFDIELDEGMLIADAKKLIAEQKSYELGSVKLIYKGKILADDATVGASINPAANDFVVVMAKAVAAAAPAAAAAAPPAAAPPAATAASPSPAAATPAAVAPPAGGAGGPSVGSEDQIAQLVGMGFPREEAVAALRAAFGNTDRATEYLLNPGSMPSANAPQEAAPMDEGDDQEGDAGGVAIEPLAESSPLFPLLQNPQFMQIRRLVQQRPELLPALLVEMSRQEPDLAAMLSANREDFYRLLNMPLQAGGGGGGGRGPMGGGGGGPQIQVTPEEREAIDRLCQLVGPGVDRMMVIQAFIACDRNEQITANYLFENSFD